MACIGSSTLEKIKINHHVQRINPAWGGLGVGEDSIKGNCACSLRELVSRGMLGSTFARVSHLLIRHPRNSPQLPKDAPPFRVGLSAGPKCYDIRTPLRQTTMDDLQVSGNGLAYPRTLRGSSRGPPRAYIVPTLWTV